MLPATISREAVEMESHPKIAPLIAQVQAAVVERLTITAEDISRVAWEIAADGEIQPSARVSALALLSRRHPEFSEKHEVTGDVRLRVEALAAIATMTPEQLKALAEKARS